MAVTAQVIYKFEDEKMYTEHEMNIVAFEESCVFADLGVSGDESGGIVVHFVNPDSSDK
ncbi:MAG: hypothetical protein LUG27_02925 [Clostridiales bacterium]|nr:hypothetical protein [Clostridiales bacterium]